MKILKRGMLVIDEDSRLFWTKDWKVDWEGEDVDLDKLLREICELGFKEKQIKMSEKGIECPECHYTWYRYYTEADNQENEAIPLYISNEVPVIIITPLGYFCRLCRHEWRKSGIPIKQEEIDKSIADFRKHGKENHAEIHGLKSTPKQDKSPRIRDRNEGFIPR